MDKKNFIIYAVYHKLFDQPTADFVVPIHAGKADSKNILPYIGDNTGENISTLNPNFCELTVLYWIWKNNEFKPTDIWGLCHYRRYFAVPAKGLFRKKRSTVLKKATAEALNAVVNEQLKSYVSQVLQNADVIVQLPTYVSKKKGKILTIEEHYNQDHIALHWKITKDIILELYPDYATSLDAFCNSSKMSFANMMIANRAVWDGYLSWLFSILFEVKKRIAIPEDAYQARVFGFISERILSLYLSHNKLRVAYMPIAFFN